MKRKLILAWGIWVSAHVFPYDTLLQINRGLTIVRRGRQRRQQSGPLRLRRVMALLLVGWFGLISLWQAPEVLVQSHTSELRGVWMTQYGAALMYQTTRLDEMIANLAKQEINTLYPAVWNHGHTLHKSHVMQRAGSRRQRNPWLYIPFLWDQDVLAALVRQAQRQHLRLIPWFEYGLMIPADAEILDRHPDWITLTQTGQTTEHPQKVIRGFLSGLRRSMMGGEQVWLNPFHPEVQQFLVDLITEVVQRYAVDGIQLDDHFGLPIAFGYDPYTVRLYQAEHNGQAPPSDMQNPEWLKWRAERLTQLMLRIQQSVKSANPEAMVSLSPNTPDFAYRKYLQDWPRWVQLGLLDEVVVQVYRPRIKHFMAVLQRSDLRQLAQQVPLSIGLYTGPMNNAKAKRHVEQEVEVVRARQFNGVSFFCWETTFGWFGHGVNLTEKRPERLPE